jgi:hypothetical protein
LPQALGHLICPLRYGSKHRPCQIALNRKARLGHQQLFRRPSSCVLVTTHCRPGSHHPVWPRHLRVFVDYLPGDGDCLGKVACQRQGESQAHSQRDSRIPISSDRIPIVRIQNSMLFCRTIYAAAAASGNRPIGSTNLIVSIKSIRLFDGWPRSILSIKKPREKGNDDDYDRLPGWQELILRRAL